MHSSYQIEGMACDKFTTSEPLNCFFLYCLDVRSVMQLIVSLHIHLGQEIGDGEFAPCFATIPFRNALLHRH